MRVFVAPHSADAPAAAGGGTGRRAYWQAGALAGGRWGGHTGRMLHMTKLSVGTRDLDDMRAWQAERIARGEQLKHRTRSFPRRAAEIVGEGSIYWVISGSTLVRQLIVDIVADHWEDGSACAAIHLDPVLVPVAGRPTRPFQGWRYLEAAAAPADLTAGAAAVGVEALPAALRRELQILGLL